VTASDARHARLQRVTSLLAIGWALLAFVFSVQANLFKGGLVPPFESTIVSGFVVISWADEAARAAGVRTGDRVVSIDGISAFQWTRARRWKTLEAGRTDRYVFEGRDGQRYSAALRPIPASQGPALGVPLYAASLLVGCAYLGLGMLVWQLRRGRDAAWAFLLFGSAAGAQLFTAWETFRAPLGYERALINMPFVGATMFHLFTTYPFEPSWIAARRWIRKVPYALAAAFAPTVLFERALGIPPQLPMAVGFCSVLVFSFLCVGVLARERYRHRRDEAAARADAMLVGAVLSFLPLLVLLVLQLTTSLRFPMSLALLWSVFFPLSVAYGIARLQLFDIRDVARSSATHGAATLVITGLYASLIAFADALVSRFNVNARSPLFSLAFLFFAVLAFNPVRARMQRLVDRVFDRDQARYRDAVGEISEAMVSMLSVREIVERMVRALTDAMGVERCTVLLLTEDERRLRPEAFGGDWAPGLEDLEVGMDHPICKYLWMRREEVSRSDVEAELEPEVREACMSVFDGLGVALLVPVLYGVDMLGVIAVGRKRSGERFHPDDRQMLMTLANQSSIAIENARAFDEIAKLNETLEARVDERTRELQETQTQLMQSEKMRSLGQLVAGVAHELNNPIGFVHANLKLLEEFVARLGALHRAGRDTARAREAIEKLIARSREGTDRVKRIVQDLRTFSRMDQAELAEVDLNHEIERTLTLMEPRLKCGIAVERDYDELPALRCHAGQLNQVFLNLLMNACDALGERGRIGVRTRAADGTVRVEVEDDGPGIAPAVRDRIFEPFYTTKPVGQGTGLGLSLSHSIIERHGGRIWAESGLAGGTRFVVEIPVGGSAPPVVA
jgi:signal transduction histidine kinase